MRLPSELLDVVVATDGSMDADLAVDWAAEEAMRRTAALLVISGYSQDGPGSSACRTALDVVDLAADRARRRFPGLVVETKVVEGIRAMLWRSTRTVPHLWCWARVVSTPCGRSGWDRSAIGRLAICRCQS